MAAVQAPVFEPALRALLDTNRIVFTVASFVLVFFVLICTVIAFGKGTTHMGFMIMVSALLAGFTSWPRGTPFMLIVMLGAHWIALSEMHDDTAIDVSDGDKRSPPEPQRASSKGGKRQKKISKGGGGQPAHDDAPPSAEGTSGAENTVAIDDAESRSRSRKGIIGRFFH